MSLHRTSIPHTFYNFQRFRNCAVNISLRTENNGLTTDLSNLDIHLEEGNYNALDIVSILTSEINSWLSGETNTQLGTITNKLTAPNIGLNFFMRYNRSELKYEWILSKGSYATTNNTAYLIFKWKVKLGEIKLGVILPQLISATCWYFRPNPDAIGLAVGIKLELSDLPAKPF
eukprot:COSAG04_NODE_13626_length_598_cov_0.805611_1_plen_173_part_01